MKSFLMLFLALTLLVSCSSKKPELVPEPSSPEAQELMPTPELTRKVSLWATYYHLPSFKSISTGYAVRDMRDKSLGVKLSKKDFCSLAMEGSGFVDGKTYNYAGTTQLRELRCQHGPSSYVKFYVTTHPYGVGNRNNPLIPFYSIACDQSKFKFGQKFYIPSALNTILPNGKKHDGKFRCDDVGGLIKKNHIDVFIGSAKTNPFKFVKSSKSKIFDAYLE